MAQLTLNVVSEVKFQVAVGSRVATVGAELHLNIALTFTSPDGHTTDAMLFVEVHDKDDINEIFFLPLSPLASNVSYRLVGISTKTPAQTFAQVACFSFSRGTHITLASSEQRRIEGLKVGDLVMTADDGPQVVKWIGQHTLRAIGNFAPIASKLSGKITTMI